MKAENLTAAFFQANRQALLERLPKDGLAFVSASDPMVRNSDQLHLYRPDSNFFYLTGIVQPGCHLLLGHGAEGKPVELLLIPPVDSEKEKWEGKMLTPEKAKAISGVAQVQNAQDLDWTLFRLQREKADLYVILNDIFPDQPLTKAHLYLERLRSRLPGLNFKKLAPLLLPLRLKKHPEEIQRIRQSLEIMERAFGRVLKTLRPGMKEYEVEAELVYEYTKSGGDRHGFDPICASGANACTLHYIENDQIIPEGSLVLMDTGCEYGMYTGDITRVFPASGRFTPRQRQCYQAVLEVNKRVIEKVRAGMSFAEISKMASEIQGEVYQREGFVAEAKNHVQVSFHRIGHTLGLDVHDVTQNETPLPEGAVITVEPGLYLTEEGIGIRIEDNVMLTAQGCEVLSHQIPKEIHEIEARMAQR